MSEKSSATLRQITREDIEFLSALQDELNTQPHQCQADPRFWVVMTPDEAVRAALEDGTEGTGCLGSRYYVERWCRDKGWRAHFETKEERIAENTMFLTLREAQEHIQRNGYHYVDPHTYGMTAWRSPQVERLYEILHEVDFSQLLEAASDDQQG